MNDNEDFMKLAINESKKSISEDGKISPKVGAVIVKDGECLGMAFRGEPFPGQKEDGSHAEYILLERKLANVDLTGAILFTTLEPCTTRGKHTPCTDWIISRKIGTVYIGMLDPNPKIYDKGAPRLQDAEIEVRHFPHKLREEVKAINNEFISQYFVNTDVSATVRFDWTKNNGRFVIGRAPFVFETAWSGGSGSGIYIYSDPPGVRGVALANVTDFCKITDAGAYDMSSRVQRVDVQGFAVVQNTEGYFAAIKIVDIKAKGYNAEYCEVTIEYRIQKNGTGDFSTEI